MGLFCNKETYIVIGLGNCEDKYENTRHNSGFRALDALAAKLGVRPEKKKCSALTASVQYNGKKLVLAKPLTYMNNSGTAAAELASFYKVKPEHMIVLYDDIDLNEGALRVRASGGPGTHNGMRDIVQKLGNGNFNRIRIGIGSPRPEMDLADYVLGKFTSDLSETFALAADAALCIIDEGAEKAQQKFNRKA